MFNFENADHATALDAAISKLFEKLGTLEGDSKEYSTTAENIVKLVELKNQALKTANESIRIDSDCDINEAKVRLENDKFAAEQEKSRSWKPSPDAIIGSVASIAGIVLVLNYEKLNVITSKAFGFIGKLK